MVVVVAVAITVSILMILILLFMIVISDTGCDGGGRSGGDRCGDGIGSSIVMMVITEGEEFILARFDILILLRLDRETTFRNKDRGGYR